MNNQDQSEGSQENMNERVADAIRHSFVYQLPRWTWPYAQLARWERPIGWWLLMWPCWWAASMGFAAHFAAGGDVEPLPFYWAHGLIGKDWLYALTLVLFMVGAVTMRGAGCTYNDLVDEDIDEQVARTRSRPLPSGRVTRSSAKLFLLAQLLLGLLILLQFNWTTVLLGFLSVITIVIYPFMKRVTWWPQLFLGFAFSWGALVGWTAMTGSLSLSSIVLYLGCICWVIGYDTIYAHQDKEDDAIVGVKSTARLFGEKTKTAMTALYAAALVLFAIAFSLAAMPWPAWVGLLAGAAHMAWQIFVLEIDDPDQCLALFKSNTIFGWIMFGGLFVSAMIV